MQYMKLLFMYGPPAVGKLTIAEELSKITGIPLFHNHLSRNIVLDIYGDTLHDHYDLVDILRNDVLAYCAANNTNLIFTFVYEGSEDDDMVKSYIRSIEDHGGEVVFIELTANKEDLLARVGSESRKHHKKLTDPAILSRLTESMTQFSIPYVKPIKINTSELDPIDSAKRIAQDLNLKI